MYAFVSNDALGLMSGRNNVGYMACQWGTRCKMFGGTYQTHSDAYGYANQIECANAVLNEFLEKHLPRPTDVAAKILGIPWLFALEKRGSRASYGSDRTVIPFSSLVEVEL